MKKILQKEESVLRKKALEVPVLEITSTKIKKILREMSAALAGQSDGVAIAAPQIGYSLRIFVVSGKVFSGELELNLSKSELGNSKRSDLGESNPDRIFINPKIIKRSREKVWVPEGCLSVRPIYGQTHRYKKATVVAYDAEGKKFTMGGSGLLAQIFQHETDHLEGILFIDHAKELREEEIPK